MIVNSTIDDELISNAKTSYYSVEDFKSNLSSRSESDEYLAIAISPDK